jgi:hypothetical protein
MAVRRDAPFDCQVKLFMIGDTGTLQPRSSRGVVI